MSAYTGQRLFNSAVFILLALGLRNIIASDCGTPQRPSQGKVTYDGTSTNSTAVYTCNAGHFMDGPGYGIDVCNGSQWEKVEGPTWRVCHEYGTHIGCMTLTNVSVLVEMPVITGDLPKDTLNECLTACKNLSHFYAARQGEHCYCTDTIADREVVYSCDDPCFDNRSYCGESPDKYTVFKTMAKCIYVSNISSLPLPMEGVRTGYTCVQLCLAQDLPLSYYKHAHEACYCLDKIPSYRSAPALCGNIVVNSNKTLDLQALELTELSKTYSSCDELFEKGVFYNGYYRLQNGTVVYCHFYDSSTSCEGGRIAFGGSCYHFHTVYGNATTHFEMCRSDDSLLVSIGSEAEMNFVWNFSKNLSPREAFYTGLYDVQAGFTYMWSDETRLTYRPFQTNYPTNLDASCIEVTSEYNAIKNVLCDNNAYGICERQEDVPGCMRVPDIDQRSITLNSSSMSIPLCFETCRSQRKGYSAVRDTFCYCFTEIDTFTALSWDQCDLSCPIHPFQICGGSDEDTVFVIRDKEQPYRSGCQEMILEGLVTNVTVQNGTDFLVYDCATEAGDLCPEFWMEVDGHCYRYFRESSGNPFHACLTFSGFVAVFESNTEQDRVSQVIRDVPSINSTTEHWIFGLRYVRGDASHLRYSNGAWLNLTAREAGPDTGFSCLALTSAGVVVDQPVSCSANAFICEKNDEFKGCCHYWERPGDTIAIDNYTEMTARVCMEACKPYGHKYAGIKEGFTCVCTNEVNQASNGTICDMYCADFQGCGSKEPDYISAYTIDYRYNASSCEELFNQGVMLNGLYTLKNGVNTWCGMKDSIVLSDYAKNCNASQNCDFTRHRFGVNESIFSLDMVATVTYPNLEASCKDRFSTATVVTNVKDKWTTDLVTDVLRWLLEVPYSIPTLIGAVDEFNMGVFTWSNGDIFRMSDLDMTQSLAYGQARSLHLTMNHMGNVMEASANTSTAHHVTCQKDLSFVGCYVASDPSALTSIESVSNYQSISIGLCRQVCQGQNKTHVFVSTSSCVCYDPDSGDVSTVLSILTATDHSDCDVDCPASRLQRCGSRPYFRLYQFEPDHVTSCQELYDNFIVYNATYIVNGQRTVCGLDDQSTSCGPGFISYKGKCYRFQRREDLTLSQAADQCLALDSYLASPADEEEQRDLEYLISQFTELRTSGLWYIGYYRTFVPGFYSSASGNMGRQGLPLGPLFNEGGRAIALNLSSSAFVPVSGSSTYPFVCETSDVISGTAEILSGDAIFEFSLPDAMSVHQCVAVCHGLGANVTKAAVSQQNCRCINPDQTIGSNRWGHKGTNHCSGHPLQICGGESNNTFTVYDLSLFPTEHLCQSCDSLFSYGVTLPTQYITDQNETVDCFKLSYRTDYVMTKVAVPYFNTSMDNGGDMRIRVDQLSIGGWQGQVDFPMYVQVDLGDIYVIEGLLLIDPFLTSVQRRVKLSVSLDNQYFQDSDHGEIIFGPESEFVWLTLNTPLVCQIVKLTFLGSDEPKISFEILGYLYANHSFEDHYLGCHAVTGNEIGNGSLAGSDYDECRSLCLESDFSILVVESPYSCRCLRTNDTRDLYDHAHCQEFCFSRSDVPCDNVSALYYAAYSVVDFECAEFTINNTDVTITTVVSTPLVNITTATSLDFSCQRGFQFNQSSTSTISTQCYNFGVWVPAISHYECVRVDCGQPPVPGDSSINTTVSGTLYGDTINYTCDGGPGWAFDGLYDSFQITCQEDEIWGPSIPSCSLKQCPSPPEVAQAVIQNSQAEYVYGDRVTYQCDDGCHFLPDTHTNKSINCLSNGDWEDIVPACVHINLISKKFQKIPDVKEFLTEALQLSSSGVFTGFRCSREPPTLANTYVVMNSTYNALYKCVDGAEFPNRSLEQSVSCNQTSFLWPAIVSCQPLLYLSGHACALYRDKRLEGLQVFEVPTRSLTDCALKCLDSPQCFKFSHWKVDPSAISQKLTRCLLSADEALLVRSDDITDDNEWDTFVMTNLC